MTTYPQPLQPFLRVERKEIPPERKLNVVVVVVNKNNVNSQPQSGDGLTD